MYTGEPLIPAMTPVLASGPPVRRAITIVCFGAVFSRAPMISTSNVSSFWFAKTVRPTPLRPGFKSCRGKIGTSEGILASAAVGVSAWAPWAAPASRTIPERLSATLNIETFSYTSSVQSTTGSDLRYPSAVPLLPGRCAATIGLAILAVTSFDVSGRVSAQTSKDAPAAGLHSPSPTLRRRAAIEVGKSKRPEALALLADLVRDPDVEVRQAVLDAIVSLRDINGVPSMVVFMGDADVTVRLASIDGVVELYTHRDQPKVSRFLSIFSDSRDKPEPLVVAAVDIEVYRSLATCLHDSSVGVRESAAEAIGILGGTDVVVDLATALRDVDAHVRSAAVTAIAKVGTSADGEALAPLLKDPSSSVRHRAIAALGRLKAADSAKDLRMVYDRSTDAEDKLLAVNSLAQIALAQDRALFQSLALQTDPARRRPGIEGLARLGETRNEARFKRDFQREKDDGLRAAYAFAIFAFGDRAFLDTVVMGLSLSRERARQARGYIEELGPKALPDVLDYLKESDPKVRAGLCDALSGAGLGDATSSIEPLTRDKDQQVASSARRAMLVLKRGR